MATPSIRSASEADQLSDLTPAEPDSLQRTSSAASLTLKEFEDGGDDEDSLPPISIIGITTQLGKQSKKEKKKKPRQTNLTNFTFLRRGLPFVEESLADDWDQYNMATVSDPYCRRVDPAEDSLEVTRQRVELLDGHNRTVKEIAQVDLDANKERIRKMRMENERRRRELAQKVHGDEHVVGNAFTDAGKKMPPRFRAAGCEAATAELDRAVSLGKKRLDLLQYNNRQRMEKIAQMEALVRDRQKEYEAIRDQEAGDSEEALTLYDLENQYMQLEMRYREGTHIHTTYQKIVDKLSEDRLHYDRIIEAMGKSIREKQKAYDELVPVRLDAEAVLEISKDQLVQEETAMLDGRQFNETILRDYQSVAEKDKAITDKVEKRQAHRVSLVTEDSVLDVKEPTPEVEEESKLEFYDDILTKIMKATGVTSEEEIVERFLTQGSTYEALKRQAEDGAEQVESLRKTRDQLAAVLEKAKYSGQMSVSRGQQLIEEFRARIATLDKEVDELKRKKEELGLLFTDVRNGVDHLDQRLKPLKEPKLSVPTRPVAMSENDRILESLAVSERKLAALMDEMQGHDVNSVIKEMSDLQFSTKLVTKLPKANTRVAMKSKSKTKVFDDDDDTEEDNAILTRDQLKKQAQELLDSKTKKKKKKKKDDGMP